MIFKKKSNEQPEEEVTQEETAQEAVTETPEEAPEEEAPQAPPLQDYEKQYGEMLDRYQRSIAEFDNFRKRTSKEKAAMYDDGVRGVAEKLLPVLDNFQRALNAGENKEDNFYQGVAMIARQLEGVLTDIGVLQIAAVGEAFDPNLHYAVAHIEDENFGTNVITDEMQKGYKHKDKVIRPSMVRVAN
jgi:molecular chaperone GrpE